MDLLVFSLVCLLWWNDFWTISQNNWPQILMWDIANVTMEITIFKFVHCQNGNCNTYLTKFWRWNELYGLCKCHMPASLQLTQARSSPTPSFPLMDHYMEQWGNEGPAHPSQAGGVLGLFCSPHRLTEPLPGSFLRPTTLRSKPRDFLWENYSPCHPVFSKGIPKSVCFWRALPNRWLLLLQWSQQCLTEFASSSRMEPRIPHTLWAWEKDLRFSWWQCLAFCLSSLCTIRYQSQINTPRV